jgi:hypothetical protein
MASSDLINAFNDSIDRLARGESIEDCLRAYPQYAADLRILLTVGRASERAVLPFEEVDAARARIEPVVEDAISSPPAAPGSPLRWIIPLLIVALPLAGILLWNSQSGLIAPPPTPTHTPTIAPTITSTPSPVPTASLTPTMTPSATSTHTPGATARTPAATRTASATPVASVNAVLTSQSACPRPLVIEGVIERIEGDVIVILGLPVTIPNAASMSVGRQVRVEGCRCATEAECGGALARGEVITTPAPNATSAPSNPDVGASAPQGSANNDNDDDD